MAGRIDWGYDAARLGTISFFLQEAGFDGGASGTVTLTGQYFHSADAGVVVTTDTTTGEVVTEDIGYRVMAPLLEAALNAIGDGTYTVTFSETAGTYTISMTGVTWFSISAVSTGAARYLGLSNATEVTTTTGAAVWHWTIGAVGGFSEWDEREVDPESTDLFGADGTVRGLSPLGLARTLDLVVPWEPEATIWTEPSSTAWAWSRAFSRCRTVEPVAVEDATDDTRWVVGYMRSDACALRPRKASADYLTHQSVPMGLYVLGRTGVAPAASIVTESGDPIVTEDGDFIITE